MKPRTEAYLFAIACVLAVAVPMILLAVFAPVKDASDAILRVALGMAWGLCVGNAAARFLRRRFRALRQERDRLLQEAGKRRGSGQ